MVTDVAEISLPDFFKTEAIVIETLIEVRRRVRGLSASRSEAKQILDEWPSYQPNGGDGTSLAVRKGFLHFVLGDLDMAIPILDEVKESEAGALVLSWCHRDQGHTDKAEAALEIGLSRHRASGPLILALIEAKLDQKKTDEAADLFEAHEQRVGGTAGYRYLEEYHQELLGEYDGAMDAYRAILKESPDHQKTLFRLAYNEDLRGDPEKALEYYRQCSEQTPAYTNALMNLGLLYEDMGEYNKAVECYDLVVRGEPTHERARMFLGDAKASLTMYYDEEKQKRTDRRAVILKTPITDFELSVRSRNCLNKMEIRSLGDLIYKTETELLAYKNFGETSLQEIKEMLAQKGLTLGMKQEDVEEGIEPLIEGEAEATTADELLDQPIDAVDLSGRSRKAMEALGILTIGDLAQKTESELLSAKNFGYTSLNEIKRKLSDLGLELAE